MNTKMRIIWSAMCLACCVNAEHVSSFDSLYNADSGYVVMTDSDKEYRSSYITAGKWSDGAVPHSGTNYYVGSEYKLTVATQRTSYVAAPFAGDELVVAGWLRDYGAAKYQTWLGKTRMLAGSEYFNNSVGSVNGGPMIIEGTEDNPVRIYGNSYNNQWKAYKVNFSSSVNVNGYVRFDGVGKNHKYLILSDLPDFYGAIMIDACTIKGAENYVNMPGGFNVYSNSTLLLDAVDGSSTLGSLKLCTGGKLSLSGVENTHCINITNKLELAEDAILTTDKFRTWVKSGTPNRYPVFRLSPEAVAAGMPDFSKVQLRTLRMWPIISLGNLRMNDVFIGCYSRPLDGRRVRIPSEWARIFRDRGGVAAVELPSGRLVLVTKEIAEKSSSAESSKAVHCKMDSRGRIIMPKVFRRMFKEVKNVVLCGSIHYVEIRRK